MLAGLLGLLLGACASQITVPQPHIDLPEAWHNTAAAPTGTPAAALDDWWQAFGDAALEPLIREALVSNLDLAQARERLLAERALWHSQDAAFRPVVEFASRDLVDPDASASYFTIGFDAVWELGLFGRREAATRIAQGELDRVTSELRQARVTLVAEVVRSWIELQAAHQRQELYQRTLEASQRKQELLGVRQQLRLADPLQLAQAEAATARATAALGEPARQVRVAAQRLALLLGRAEPDPAWLTQGKLPALAPRTPAALPADLLRNRPDVAQAQARVLHAAGELGLAQADRYPNIGIGGSILWSTRIMSHRRVPRNQIASLGPMIHIPLFDWGMRRARQEASDHQLKAEVLAYRQTVLTGVAEVETALGNLAFQQQREQAGEQAVQALQQAAQHQAVRQNLGLSNGIAASDSAIELAQAELDLVDARAARGIAWAALYKALGGAPMGAGGTASAGGAD